MFIYLQMLETPEEKSKFEQIYLEYRDLMFYIANRILHNQQDSEDVVHEAFLKIIKIIGQIDNPKCPQTKNLTVIIVERVAIDLWRRRQKIQYVSMDEEDIDIVSDKVIENIESQSSLALAMATLPAMYRELLLLRYDNGFSETEVAQIMSISQANVHKSIQRAKKKLQLILEKQER
ncbi:RNA polymerase sigma factor [Intestinimonas butyriciproducens]|uniref:RNA polymerase sigma factor n=1 Tax=Intestinimonas butyriciproducens TaxID=1297617 RepID=UPI001959DCEC|nr:sigma-70 family RNA polymerase sigma factor [Intestinimonas butyriciproducens]MBM6974983.1 sigma-70 family RNA polymerase sigma factor [Intestinimonas butyriciproducens]